MLLPIFAGKAGEDAPAELIHKKFVSYNQCPKEDLLGQSREIVYTTFHQELENKLRFFQKEL